MEIRKVLGLSTSHITKQTADLLEKESEENNLGLTVYPFPYGYWVFISNDTDTENDNLPKDLQDCIHLAQVNNCQWLQLDCDGPEENILPTYE